MAIPSKDANLRADYAAPAVGAVLLTPSDSTDLVVSPARAIYIGGAGNINVDTAAGDTVLFSGVTAGMILPVSVKRVRATSTTATNIVALY